ncbi:Aste57867_3549 [Aphanomyces stellatus]|uniref:Aste57867_3549 protein n=1 Tax=Aphanomyces stellatus TaxID=120398 RepID=A0A485K9X9_9STRA|nr:hypothetical protein As57867_003538 [Aphanomyces stellatus]VFT80712.1 Aste57867_3549 [Aphanomyces stellatus]
MSAVNPKTHAIAELMQKLKAGEISKAELFLELSKLQPTGAAAVTPTPDKAFFKRTSSFVASVAAESEHGSMTQASLYDTDRAGVSHDQARRISVQQLLASRLAAEKGHSIPSAIDEATVSGPSIHTPVHASPNFQEGSMSGDDHCSSQHNGEDYDNPSRYVHYMDEDSFHVRVSRWKQQKENLKEKLKQEQLEVELGECTFQPTINPKSQKVASKLRHRSTDSVADRLYKDVINYKLRDELALRAREQEEEDQRRECTFKPHVNKSPWVPTVRSKYKEPVYNKKFTATTPTSDMDECTFNPKINAIPKDMVSAQLYTQQNIFDRLSRPATALDTPETPDPSDVTTTPGPSVSGDDPQSRTVNEQSRPTSAGSVGDADERKTRFDEFMQRQQAQERERQRKLDDARRHGAFEFKPEINKKSSEIMQQGRKGDFIERVAKYALRKEHEKLKKKSIKLQDPQCTFKPKINDVSAKRTPRSVTELSRGDLLKKETTQRLMKLRMEQTEMSQLTFKPAVNSTNIPNVESKLKVLSNPETYVQRLQEQTLKLYEKQRKALQEQEIEEFSECTFKPQTIDVPSYISRIAKSMELTKAVKAKHEQQQMTRRHAKPEWK